MLCIALFLLHYRKRKNHKRGTTIDVKVNRIVINVISEKNQNNSLIDNEEGVTTKTIHTERIGLKMTEKKVKWMNQIKINLKN